MSVNILHIAPPIHHNNSKTCLSENCRPRYDTADAAPNQGLHNDMYIACQYYIQYNLNGSNPDGSFTWMIRTLFSVPTKSFQYLKKTNI